jgi:hypothetical protein
MGGVNVWLLKKPRAARIRATRSRVKKRNVGVGPPHLVEFLDFPNNLVAFVGFNLTPVIVEFFKIL